MFDSQCVRRLLLVCLLVACLPANILAYSGAVSWQNISIVNDKVTIDFNGAKVYSVEQSENGDALIVKVACPMKYTWTYQLPYNSALIAKAELIDIQGVGYNLILFLNKPISYKTQVFYQPYRAEISMTDTGYTEAVHQLTDKVTFDVVNYKTVDGPVRAYVIDAQPNSDYQLQALLDGKILGLTRLSNFADRIDILAAINANYFAKNGEIIGVLKIGGKIISSDKIARAVVGFSETGAIKIAITQYQGKVELPDTTLVNIDYVNRSRYENSLIKYTSEYADRTHTNAFGREFVVVDGVVAAINDGNSIIPMNGYVLSANGGALLHLLGLNIGDKVVLCETLGTDIDACGDAVGAGPQLIQNGKLNITSKEERVLPDISIGRAPRTALAYTKAGHTLMVIVDGRQSHSIGMSLSEFAGFLLKLNADTAINLDGGGSSELLINGNVINLPSDKRERAIASAVALVKK